LTGEKGKFLWIFWCYFLVCKYLFSNF
jgi:hypothetical protein